jgi:hypothetical protein
VHPYGTSLLYADSAGGAIESVTGRGCLSSSQARVRPHVRFRRVTGVTVVGVRGHLVAAEALCEDTAILQSLMSVGHADPWSSWATATDRRCDPSEHADRAAPLGRGVACPAWTCRRRRPCRTLLPKKR